MSTSFQPEDVPPSPDLALHHCPACGGPIFISPGGMMGDCPCPHCRWLLWFVRKPTDKAVVLTFLPGLIAGSESSGRVDELLSVAGTPPQLVLNLSQLRVVTSMFLAMLVRLHKRVAEGQGVLRLCGLSTVSRDVMRTTQLDTLLKIFEDEKEALAGL